MKLFKVTDPEFHAYGRVLSDFDTTEMVKALGETPRPADSTIYVASDPALEELASGKELQRVVYGELPVQIGYCNGYNKKLNALEYHRSSEINLAENDLILLLGLQTEIADDFTFNTENVKAFLVPAGTAVEVYATTLHYAPCSANDEPFRCLVVLPKGTNEALTSTHGPEGEDKLLTAINKWLIAHEEAAIDGAFNGLIGENLVVD